MTETSPAPAQPGEPAKKPSRAGRDLPAAIGSAVVLVGAIVLTLVFWKPSFMVIVAAAVVVAIWEMHQGLKARDIDIPQEPLMLGGVIMVVVAYLFGAPALVTATAVSALATMLWLLRRGVHGYVQNATASVFTLIYIPFLGSFVALLLAEDEGRRGRLHVHRGDGRLRHRWVRRRRAVRQAPDGAGDLAEEVLGGLRRLGPGVRGGRAGCSSSTCSTATGGSASSSA